MPPALEMVLTGALAVGGLMLVLWLIHLPMRNAAIVDAGWSDGLVVLAVIYGLLGDGYGLRRWLMVAMVAVWGLRLAIYLLATRVIGRPEEGRYQELRRRWVRNIPFKFLIFFQFQALLGVILSPPFLVAAMNPAPRLSVWELAAAALWLVAMGGEIAADAQLSAFKANPANRGRTCRQGLWRYSRHPNYFFEWLIWMAYAWYALASPYGYLGLISPALILFFLFRVTGIPATEAQALRTKGDDYRDYQRTTSVFVPWFPRRQSCRQTP